MKFLSDLATNKRAWLLLTLSALGLELCALAFQYLMDLKPCIMCVYQRLAIVAIGIAGLIGMVGHNQVIARTTSYALWGTGAIWGALIALEHIEMQNNSGSLFFSCEYIPNFPSWAPLHEWIPFLFEATGDCGEISWQFLGFSMPEWMVVVYGVYSLAFIAVLLARLAIAKKL